MERSKYSQEEKFKPFSEKFPNKSRKVEKAHQMG